ncbi:MAG: LysR family transcriptional regulator [Clostridium sp.]|nr:LysR family transcriptional regulator [Clostridium sp.]
MEIKQLEIFITIVEEGNITAASKKLHIAQPALSNHLKVMEQEFETKLMHRGSRRMTLTNAGKILYRKAKHILDIDEAVHKEIYDYNNGLTGTLKLGITSTAENTLLNKIFINFSKENPLIKYELYESNTYKIIELLNAGIIEVGIVRTPFNKDGLDITYWNTEPMIALYNSNYNFSDNKNSITIKDLKNKPIILIRRFKKMIKVACLNEGFDPNIFCLNDNLQLNLLWAQAGLGIAVTPMSALNLKTEITKDLNYKIIDEETFYTHLTTVTVKDRYISKIAQKFIEEFQ